MGDVTLRYDGGADVMYHDSRGARRRAVRGQAFSTDERTAQTLLDSDSAFQVVGSPGRVSIGGATGPATATPPTASAQALPAGDDPSKLTVPQLREQLVSAGLDDDGAKAVLVERLTTFRAGQAASAVTSANPLVSDPASSEAEPLAPAPPSGGTLPVDGPSVMAMVPPEQPGTGSAPGTGAVTIGDLPDSGKVK